MEVLESHTERSFYLTRAPRKPIQRLEQIGVYLYAWINQKNYVNRMGI
jgi:hypothetical protein